MKLGVKMTIQTSQQRGRIELQGLTKDTNKAESGVKEYLHRVKDQLTEQQNAVMLAQFVSTLKCYHTDTAGEYFRMLSCWHNWWVLQNTVMLAQLVST